VRPEFSAGDGEPGSVQPGLPGMNPDPILQLGQARRGRLPLIDRAAQGIQECSLPDRIVVAMLGQQPRRRSAVLTGQRPPRPAPGAEQSPSHRVLSSSTRRHCAATCSGSLAVY
jgi:hypothetical protein